MKLAYLNGINIVGNHNELGFLLLNQGGDSVDTLADNIRALGRGISLSLGTSLGPIPQPLLLGLFALRAVLVQKLQQLSGC